MPCGSRLEDDVQFSYHGAVTERQVFPVPGSNLEQKVAIMKQSRTGQTRIVAPTFALLTCLLSLVTLAAGRPRLH